MKIATLILTLSLALTACTATPSATPPAASPAPTTPSVENTATPPSVTDIIGDNSLADTHWVLESFGAIGAETAVIGETPLTLEFVGGGQVGGNGGCNSYSGSYQVEGNTLVLGEMISTLVACVDTALMDQETQYMDALQTVSEFQIDSDHLTLTYNEGQGTLNYISASASPSEPEIAPTETPAPEAQAPTGASQHYIWNCYTCGGNQVWNFENGQASRIELPVQLSNFYGYAPATDRILYGSPLPLMGGGPSQITISDLWTLHVASGQVEPLFSDQAIVEAEWASDGEHFAYVLATDTTYELHWQGSSGEDKLLASDVAFTFSIAPNSEQVAFTRESNYGLPGQPGLYVVEVATGEEILISDADRAGSGSIDDKPLWSPNGQNVLLPTYGTTGGPGLVRAAADGSNTTALQFNPALAAEEWYQAEPFSPFWVSNTQMIAAANVGSNSQMGGLAKLVLYQLNSSLDTIVDGAVFGEGLLIGWDVPGTSVWVQVGADMQSIPLPTL